MGWSDKYKKSIDCDNPKGFSQKSHCQGKKKKLDEEGLRDWFGKSKSKDGKKGWVNVVTGGTCASDEPGEGVPKCVSSTKRASMTKAERISAARRKRRNDPGQQEKSGAATPTYVSTDKPKMNKEEFELEEAKDKPGKSSGKKDACYHKVKSRYSVWPSAYASGALVKCRKVGADSWGTKTEEKDHEYSMARSELSTISSAVKRLKKKMKGEGNIKAWVQSKITKAADYIDTAADYLDSGEHKVEESITVQDSDGNDYVQFIDIIKPQPLQPSKGIGSELLDEAGKKCWKGYEKKGTQTLFGKTYNRCVKAEGYSNWRQELLEQSRPSASGPQLGGWKIGGPVGQHLAKPKPKPQSNLDKIRAAGDKYGKKVFGEDWQSANKKDRTDGMGKEAIKKYREENPNSKLKSAVTGDPKPGSEDANRRAAYCRRSKGQQDMHNIDCSKDPDKAICKARRRWKC